MRNVAISLLVLLISLTAFGQTLNMSINGKVEHIPNHLDAKVYYPVKDWNDNLCALIKVRTTKSSKLEKFGFNIGITVSVVNSM